MLKALGITSKNDENYKYVNAMYRDLYYYVHLAKNYAYKSYMDRGKFTSKTQFDNVDNETILLKILNDKLNPDTPYTSVADWITRNVTENGFYQVKKYERATANTGEQVQFIGEKQQKESKMINTNKYETPEMEITKFDVNNVIMEDHTVPITGNDVESITDIDPDDFFG